MVEGRHYNRLISARGYHLAGVCVDGRGSFMLVLDVLTRTQPWAINQVRKVWISERQWVMGVLRSTNARMGNRDPWTSYKLIGPRQRIGYNWCVQARRYLNRERVSVRAHVDYLSLARLRSM